MEILIYIGIYLIGLIFTAIVCGIGIKYNVGGLDHPMWAVFWPISWCIYFIPAMIILPLALLIKTIIEKFSGKESI